MAGDVFGFYSSLGVDLPERSGREAKVRCFANTAAHRQGDRHPSCSVNTSTGAWLCFTCGAKGGPYDAALATGLDKREAMGLLEEYGFVEGRENGHRNGHGSVVAATVIPEAARPTLTVTMGEVEEANRRLLASPAALARLQESRGWTPEMIRRLQIGMDAKGVTIPGFDGDGPLVSLIHYQPSKERLGESGKKSVAAPGSERVLLPAPESLDIGDDEFVLLVEGEPDAALVTSLGLKAVGVPGVSGWKREWASRFESRRVVVLFDADGPGRRAAQGIAEDLAEYAAEVRIVDPFPGIEDGSDVTDLVLEGMKGSRELDAYRSAREFVLGLAERAPVVERPEPSRAPVGASPRVKADEWPEPPDEAAYHGLAGEFVRAIGPHSEADPAAILAQLLVAFGSAVGRGPFFEVEADRHYTNLFVTLVGDSSKGRKGTSWGHVKRSLRRIDEEWYGRILGGLSSGEGLIHSVRDPLEKEHGDEMKVVDAGVDDKRLLVFESEFASVLKMNSREGNILSAVLRQAWDDGDLRTLVKNSPESATGAHISAIGHITDTELRRYLDATESANGFGNRFIWLCVRRSKFLPDGGSLTEEELTPLVNHLKEALRFTGTVEVKGRMQRDQAASVLWRDVYPALSTGRPGLAGAMTGRAEAQVTRLSVLYALLDLSPVIREPHLRAALALWDYAERSVEYVFGESLGNPDADSILRSLKHRRREGMSRTEIRDLFNRNRSADQIGRALAALEEHLLATMATRQTGGKPEERWYARGYDINDQHDQSPPRDDLWSLRSSLSHQDTGAPMDPEPTR